MITTTVRAVFECDHEPELCLRQPTVIAKPSVFDCYNQARRDGWYIAGKRCLCPRHAAEQNAERVMAISGR